MPALDILGADALAEQGKRYNFQAGGVKSQLWTFKGPLAQVRAKFDELEAAALIDPRIQVMDLDEGRGLATLAVVYADQQAQLGVTAVNGVKTLYELIPNEFSKRPELAPYFEDLTTDEIITAYKAYRAGVDTTAAAAAPYSLADEALNLFKLLSRGVEEYLESAYVLRESKVVSGSNALQANFANINRVENPPSNASANTLIGDLSERGGEWLKKAPTIRQISRSKWAVQTEWWWANAWSNVLYGGTLTP